MRDNPEVGALVMAALEPVRDRLFRAARAEGRREAAEAYAADALVERARMATTSAAGRAAGASRPKVIVRVDLDALLRGRPVGREVAEIAGVGPVAVSAVRDMLDSGDPFLAAVATRGVDGVGVAHLGRRPTAPWWGWADGKTALEWLYPTCAAEGCAAVAHLEVDHRVDWARTRITLLDLLDRLCPHHHDLKTLDGWALVRGRGKRAFVPPGDARHPRHAARDGHARPPVPVATGPPVTV